MPAKAAQFPKLSGEAEDVLVLEPDVVVAGRFTKRATRELLKEKGLRVVEFDAARSLEDVKKQIRQMGDLVQHPDRAAAEIKRLDAAIAHAREVVSRKRYRVLALSRRGWVSGGDSLTSALLATTGLSNAAILGFKLGGFAAAGGDRQLAGPTFSWCPATVTLPRTKAALSCCIRRWSAFTRLQSVL